MWIKLFLDLRQNRVIRMQITWSYIDPSTNINQIMRSLFWMRAIVNISLIDITLIKYQTNKLEEPPFLLIDSEIGKKWQVIITLRITSNQSKNARTLMPIKKNKTKIIGFNYNHPTLHLNWTIKLDRWAIRN